MASVRRQGVRGDSILKDSDNLLQRYRNLQTRLQKQVEAQDALEGECDSFSTQAENTRTWITDLLQTLTSPVGDMDMKSKAQVSEARSQLAYLCSLGYLSSVTSFCHQMILSSQPVGDSKVMNLRSQGQSLCELEDLQDSRKQKVHQLLREIDEQWRMALQAADEALRKAETRALLDKDVDAFRTQKETLDSWVRDQEHKLQSVVGHMQVEEKIQIVQVSFACVLINSNSCTRLCF